MSHIHITSPLRRNISLSLTHTHTHIYIWLSPGTECFSLLTCIQIESWTLTYTLCQGKECVELYLHTHIRFLFEWL